MRTVWAMKHNFRTHFEFSICIKAAFKYIVQSKNKVVLKQSPYFWFLPAEFNRSCSEQRQAKMPLFYEWCNIESVLFAINILKQSTEKLLNGPRQANLVLFAYASRGTLRQKIRSLNSWTCAVEIGHEGMLEDTNSLDGAQMI